MANDTVRYHSTLLIPVDVVWMPYTSLVLIVIFWLGYDFYRFHQKNKLKYARMRETLVVESTLSKKRINMISSKGLKYKNGLPDFGTVWNTSPSCSDVSTPSPSIKKYFPHSTDISPSEDGGGLRITDDEDGIRTASEISPHADGVPVPDDRRKIRAPRQAGSSGGGADRFKDETFGSQSSQGFPVGDRHDDGSLATLNVVSIQKMKGRRSRERSGDGAGSHDGGGGGGGSGGGGGGGGGDGGGGGGGGSVSSRQRKAAEDDELRFTESREESENNNNNKYINNSNNNMINNNNNNNNNANVQSSDGCVVGDMGSQTAYTVADLHYSPGRMSPQVSGEGVYTHPGVVNPRVLAISPPSQGQGGGSSSRTTGSTSPSAQGGHSSSSSPRSHRRTRHDSTSSSTQRSPRAAATAAEFAAQSLDEELNKPIIIDFSRSNSMRDERNQDSPSNPATPRHQSRRHEPRPMVDDYGPAPPDRRSYEPVVLKDEAVFPGSMRRGPSSQDVMKIQEAGLSHSRQHSSPSYSSSPNIASSNVTSNTSSKSRSASSVSKRHQHHHHQPQPPPYSQQQQHQSSQHMSTSSSRHSIKVESYEDAPPSPRTSRSTRESRSRGRDSVTSSGGRKQIETHYRHPQHLDMKDSRDSNSHANSTIASSSSARDTPRSSRSERSSERSESTSQQYKESRSSQRPSSSKHSTSSSPRQVKSARTSSSSSQRTSSERRNRKNSDSSKHSSSESPKIPSHFYNQDEEGFFSSMPSTDHNNHARLDNQQQLPRRGIHFFSQLGTGRRDSLAGFGGGGRKAPGSGVGGGGFGEDDGDGDYTSSSGYKGGGFDS